MGLGAGWPSRPGSRAGPSPGGARFMRLRRMNLARDLLEAGFEQVEVTDKPGWHAARRTLRQAALQAGTSGDPALASLQEEATQALAAFDVKRRVLATATAPAHAA